jgi:hypothetical protein
LGWPANPTKSGPKKQKRGLVSSLDSLNLELFAKVFAKKSKKKTKIELRQPPNGYSFTFFFTFLFLSPIFVFFAEQADRGFATL